MRTGTLVVALIFTSAAVACAVWLGQPAESRPVQKTEAAGSEDWPRPSPTGPHPKAVCDEPTYDFGASLAGERASHTFVIRNEGEADLLLGKGGTTCKCTLSEMAQREIPPGESAEVTLTWTPEQPVQQFSQSAEIRTNDPENQVIRLEVRGMVDELIRLEPSGVWTVGQISASEPRALTGGVRSAFLEEFQIREIVSSDPGIEAEAVEVSAEQLAGTGYKSGYMINVTLSPGGTIGPFNEELTLRTDINGGTDLQIQVSGHRAGPVHIVPFAPARWYEGQMLIGLGRFPASDGRSGKLAMFVNLPPEGDLELEVESTSPEFLKASLERDTSFQSETRVRYSLTVEVPPGLPPTTRTGDNAGTITFRTNHPASPEFTIKVGFVSFRAS